MGGGPFVSMDSLSFCDLFGLSLGNAGALEAGMLGIPLIPGIGGGTGGCAFLELPGSSKLSLVF